MISCVLIILPAKNHPRKDFPTNLLPRGPDKGVNALVLTQTASDEFVRFFVSFSKSSNQKKEKGSCLYSLSPFQFCLNDSSTLKNHEKI